MRLNPSDTSLTVLAKTLFNQKLPVWAILITGIQNSRAPNRTGIRTSWKGNTDFPGIPTQIWEGSIQTKLAKKEILAVNTTQVVTETLETKAKAELEENKYKYILYTDASVNILSNPPGSAAIGYIWYENSSKYRDKSLEINQDDPMAPNALAAPDKHQCQELARGSASIGNGHSSYSAESIAIIIGLKNEPRELSTDNVGRIATKAPCIAIAEDANAICQAPSTQSGLEDTNGQGTNLASNQRIGIFTDSLSNITTINGGAAETPEQVQLLKSIANYSRPITLYHVRAHRNNQKTMR